MLNSLRRLRAHSTVFCAAFLLVLVCGCGDTDDGSGEEGGNNDGATTVTSSFDADDEGWTLVALESRQQADDPDYTTVTDTLDLTWEAAGGVDGSGYIEHGDNTDAAAFFTAPPEFLGDKMAYLGGSIDFQLQSSTIDTGGDAALILQGAETTLATRIAPPDAGWSSFEVGLDTGNRPFYENNLEGEQVDAATLAAVLSDLQALRISAEYASGSDEVVGLDEVSLVGP